MLLRACPSIHQSAHHVP